MKSDEFQAIAWRDCLEWAIHEPAVIAAFCRETGTMFVAPKNALEAMIDAATGNKPDYAGIEERFVAWFNENIWGEPEPKGVRK